MEKQTAKNIIIFSIIWVIFLGLVGIMVWNVSGYAPCSWYQFNANTTIQREVMQTCLK